MTLQLPVGQIDLALCRQVYCQPVAITLSESDRACVEGVSWCVR